MASEFLRRALVDYIIFFIFLGILINLGAGGYITSDVNIQPPEYSGSILVDVLNNMGYFTDLMSASVQLQAFTSIVMIPFFVILILFIIETVRGH